MKNETKVRMSNAFFLSISALIIIIYLAVALAPCLIGGGVLYLGDKALEQNAQK